MTSNATSTRYVAAALSSMSRSRRPRPPAHPPRFNCPRPQSGPRRRAFTNSPEISLDRTTPLPLKKPENISLPIALHTQMRLVVCLALCSLALAQTPDPAYAPLARAYGAPHIRDYDTAVSNFLTAIAAAPDRAAIRKDLAYTYLKIGENTLALSQFAEVMRRDPADTQVALDY